MASNNAGFPPHSHSPINNFDGSNCRRWSFEIGLTVKQRLCWGIIPGTDIQPDSVSGSDVADTASRDSILWHQRQDITLSTILLVMECRMQDKYMDYNDPKELWERVKADYVTQIQKSTFTVRKELYGIRLLESGGVEAYAHRIQQGVDQFNFAVKDSSKKMSSEEHSLFLVNGPPGEVDDSNVCIQLLQKKIDTATLDKKPDEIINKPLSMEAELRKEKGTTSDVLLYTRPPKNNSGNSSWSNDRTIKQCSHCGYNGHTINEPSKKTERRTTESA